MTTETRAVIRLRSALVDFGSTEAQWILQASDSQFYEAWGSEIDALVEYGECEVSGRYTYNGVPVIVSL